MLVKGATDSKVYGANMGPTWGPHGTDRTRVGPMLAPWALLSGTRCAKTACCYICAQKCVWSAWIILSTSDEMTDGLWHVLNISTKMCDGDQMGYAIRGLLIAATTRKAKISQTKFSTLLAHCEGNPPVTGEFPSKRRVARGLDIFYDLCLNTCWANNRYAGDFRRHRAHRDVALMYMHV